MHAVTQLPHCTQVIEARSPTNHTASAWPHHRTTLL
uniref:Uncharacterized protein n=1 Tax=Arundo donax TaxID=35708 RepID=A0A0A9FGL8_ARUDO